MSITKRNVTQEQVPASDTTIYTAGNVSWAEITHAKVHNADASNNTSITVNVIRGAGSASSSNLYINKIVPSDSTLSIFEIVGTVLLNGDSVSIAAGAANDLNFDMGIKEVIV